MIHIDPRELDCAKVNDNGDITGEITPGDCPVDAKGNPTTNDIYIDATGVTGAWQDSNSDLSGYAVGRSIYDSNESLDTVADFVVNADPSIGQLAPSAQELTVGAADDTAGSPTVCSVGGFAQLTFGSLQGGYFYDSSGGGRFYGSTRATPGKPDSIVSPITGKTTPLGAPLSFSANVKVNTKGTVSGGVTLRDSRTGLGIGASYNEYGTPGASVSWQCGALTAGATATFGIIGDPKCR